MSEIIRRAISAIQDTRDNLAILSEPDVTNSVILLAYETCNAQMQRIDSGISGEFLFAFRPFLSEHDPVILSECRYRMIEYIDRAISFSLTLEPPKPILDTLITKISDRKISTLLKEFNTSRIHSPNISAISFRTILSLIIAKRAKLVDPESRFSNKQDLAFEPDINYAIDNKIFDEGATRLLKRFKESGGKDVFDIVAHKKGETSLIEIHDLSDTVDLLNYLLPSII
jgi:hypothetical protein